MNILDNIKLDRSAPVPLYHQLEKEVCAVIESGLLQPGDRLPDGAQMMAALGVSKRTVTKALDTLAGRGLIARRKRAGTFVADRPSESLPSIGFFYLYESQIFMLKVAERIQRFCAQRNYDLKIIAFDRDFYDEVDLCREFKRRNLSGAIVVALDTPGCWMELSKVEKEGFPYVRFGNAFFTGKLRAPLIRGDDNRRCREALEHLWANGHRRIGLAYSRCDSEHEREYLLFYANKGGFNPGWFMDVPFSGPSENWTGFTPPDQALEYLRANPDITAVILESGAACMEFVMQVKSAGIRVPEDLSCVCLNFGRVAKHGITAFDLSAPVMAEHACNALFDVMAKRDTRPGAGDEHRVHLCSGRLRCRSGGKDVQVAVVIRSTYSKYMHRGGKRCYARPADLHL